VTASPFEAQDYLDAADEIVEGVTMPDGVIAWVQAFCDHHHVDEPFKKRKRKQHDPNQDAFSRKPGHSATQSYVKDAFKRGGGHGQG
jgi:hypothetical protein